MSLSVPLPEAARVHHQTVTDHSEGVRHFTRRRLRAVKDDSTMTTFRVHPNVWAIALKAANGDAHRIEIHSETDITVHNSRVW